MRLTPPKKIVFIIALILAVLAVVSVFVAIPFVSTYSFWVAFAAWALLAAGNYFKGF